MLKEISQYIKDQIKNYSNDDSLVFDNKVIPIKSEDFVSLNSTDEFRSIAFIDGGQAEIISSGNFCLSIIRVAAVILGGNHKEKLTKEFYLFTKAKFFNNNLFYESKIFGDKLIDEKDLLISSNDNSIKVGFERAPISKVANMARRFAELSLVNEISSNYFILDGTLEKTFVNEEKYLTKIGDNVCSIAKSSSLFTTLGNSPIILLNQIGPTGCWRYHVNERTSFVKLNKKAKHVFRFEGNKDVLSSLLINSNDALFLGYPYGLILADKLARVSNEEKKSLKMKFLLDSRNKEISNYLTTTNAHEILDNLS